VRTNELTSVLQVWYICRRPKPINLYLHHLKYCETNQNKLKLDQCRPRVGHFTSVPDLLLQNRRAQLEPVSRNSGNYLDILMKEILLIFCFSIMIHYRSLLSKARVVTGLLLFFCVLFWTKICIIFDCDSFSTAIYMRAREQNNLTETFIHA